LHFWYAVGFRGVFRLFTQIPFAFPVRKVNPAHVRSNPDLARGEQFRLVDEKK
jgi:hypothetical protein